MPRERDAKRGFAMRALQGGYQYDRYTGRKKSTLSALERARKAQRGESMAHDKPVRKWHRAIEASQRAKEQWANVFYG